MFAEVVCLYVLFSSCDIDGILPRLLHKLYGWVREDMAAVLEVETQRVDENLVVALEADNQYNCLLEFNSHFLGIFRSWNKNL